MEPTTTTPFTPQQSLEHITALVDRIQEEIGHVIVGQEKMVLLLLTGLLSDGHLLIEGVPGVAKTLTAKLLAKLIDAGFSRIQFTPDLMPSDVIGTNIFHPQTGAFQFKSGPIFSNIVLIDEINRAPAKTQAALFEAMEERQITVDGATYMLAPPFVVIATQNPIEHEGTYRLPEAQLDRFMMKINVGYPSLEEEVKILSRQHEKNISEQLAAVKPIITHEQLTSARAAVNKVHVEEKMLAYIAKLIHNTRSDRSLFLGASPRASLALLKTSKAMAVLKGRDFIIPEDVLELLEPVVAHRVTVTPDKEMEGILASEILKDLAAKVEVPR